jgi:REP element-mobilizing transposase RayT
MCQTWNLPPLPPGFQGLRDDLPLTVYEQHLPHWRQEGATYFVTFRLHDSLPQSKLRELESFRAEWQRRHPRPHSRADNEDLARQLMCRIDACLDQGLGSCVLRFRDVSAILVEALHHDDGHRQELDSYVIMPNHVHAIVRPLAPATVPLEMVLHGWKGRSSCDIHRHLQQSGMLWQRESYDTIIRDEEHLYRVIQYIGRNPKRAGLATTEVRLWIRPSWVQYGWGFAEP